MRIDSFARQQQNSYPSGNQKKKRDKQNQTDDQPDHITLSPEIILLNKLLDLPENRFTPYPFYFVNATVKNIKTLCQIAGRIQQKAEELGVRISQNMIYDLLISKTDPETVNSIHWAKSPTAIDSGNSDLSDNEKILFEKLHFLCLEKKISVAFIEVLATEYIKKKHSIQATALTKTDQITTLYGLLYKDGNVQQFNKYNKVLLSLIKQL